VHTKRKDEKGRERTRKEEKGDGQKIEGERNR
jgi:hypothetical protein